LPPNPGDFWRLDFEQWATQFTVTVWKPDCLVIKWPFSGHYLYLVLFLVRFSNGRTSLDCFIQKKTFKTLLCLKESRLVDLLKTKLLVFKSLKQDGRPWKSDWKSNFPLSQIVWYKRRNFYFITL
jgi:hypothetical protein